MLKIKCLSIYPCQCVVDWELKIKYLYIYNIYPCHIVNDWALKIKYLSIYPCHCQCDDVIWVLKIKYLSIYPCHCLVDWGLKIKYLSFYPCHIVVDWALKIKYLSIYPCHCHQCDDVIWVSVKMKYLLSILATVSVTMWSGSVLKSNIYLSVPLSVWRCGLGRC